MWAWSQVDAAAEADAVREQQLFVAVVRLFLVGIRDKGASSSPTVSLHIAPSLICFASCHCSECGVFVAEKLCSWHNYHNGLANAHLCF